MHILNRFRSRQTPRQWESGPGETEIPTVLKNSIKHQSTLAFGSAVAPAMLTKKPIVLETEGLGHQSFHGRVVLLVDRHTASAAEMIVAFACENQLATIIGEKTAGRLLSATSVKVGNGFRLALPTGAYYTWNGAVLEGTPIEPDKLIEFDWRSRRNGLDQHLECAVGWLHGQS